MIDTETARTEDVRAALIVNRLWLFENISTFLDLRLILISRNLDLR